MNAAVRYLCQAAALVAIGVTLVAVAALPSSAQPLEKIRIGLVPSDDITPVVYALHAGLFKQAGLDVELEPASSGAAVAAAVVAGAYEMGKSSLVSLMNAHLRGLPLVIVANGGTYEASAPYAELVVAADLPYRSAADLNGKLIGVSALNDLNTVATDAWVDQNGGDSKTLRFVEIPNSAVAAALQAHRIDAAIMLYPPLAEALEQKQVRILGHAFSAIASNFVYGAWFATPTWAAQHKREVDTFARVFYQAARYTNTHHAETVQMMSDITKIPAAVFANMPRTDSAVSMDAKDLQAVIDAAARFKAIPRDFPAEELIYTSKS